MQQRCVPKQLGSVAQIRAPRVHAVQLYAGVLVICSYQSVADFRSTALLGWPQVQTSPPTCNQALEAARITSTKR
jgi:hypothetical protein